MGRLTRQEVTRRQLALLAAMTGEEYGTMTTKTLAIGSWTSDTLRTEDWAGAALDMAASVGMIASGNGRQRADGHALDDQSWLGEYLDHDSDDCDADDCEFCDEEMASEVLGSLIDTLQEHAPIYCYVGGNENDPAAFGVWPYHDAIDEAIRNAAVIPGSTDRNGAGSYVNVEDGVIIDVSDHGNVAVYSLQRGESLLSLV